MDSRKPLAWRKYLGGLLFDRFFLGYCFIDGFLGSWNVVLEQGAFIDFSVVGFLVALFQLAVNAS